LTDLDGISFGLLCLSSAELGGILDDLKAGKRTSPTAREGVKSNPLVKMAREERMILHRCASEFGLSPSSRSGIRVQAAAQEPSKLDLLISGKRVD
jgi:P27 family predicted phage terminase small subunit